MPAKWYIRRLMSMSPVEIVHRVLARCRIERERKVFSKLNAVYDITLYGKSPVADLTRLGLNADNADGIPSAEIDLLGPHEYGKYRTKWHASFCDGNDWPMRFSADYDFGAEWVPGDIRTNWELNRHRQFAVLAKSHLLTGDIRYFDELCELFADWNEINPFMWGPEWASSMELAIRSINWLFSAAFLAASGKNGELVERLCRGSWVMAAHIRRHYSKYSSANNHAIVEAAAVAIVAMVFHENRWLTEALNILSREVQKQTYEDGVNKEQALHYQLFVMEAICLVLHTCSSSGIAFPRTITDYLARMASYVSACDVGLGGYVEFGDDDEGVILALGATKQPYPEYVLSLVALETCSSNRWTDRFVDCETLRWLYEQSKIEKLYSLKRVPLRRLESFPEGGVTFLRSCDDNVVVAFDHGSLGFGQLAAHGHADALSVQLYVDGRPVLVDPGTFVYNGDRENRDLFRSTGMHNTVCLEGRSQSEVLGPFLWGRRARITEFSASGKGERLVAMASHDGYRPAMHERVVAVEGSTITIVDSVTGDGSAEAKFHLTVPGLVSQSGSVVVKLPTYGYLQINSNHLMTTRPFQWSPRYGVLEEGTEISVTFEESSTVTLQITGRGRA